MSRLISRPRLALCLTVTLGLAGCSSQVARQSAADAAPAVPDHVLAEITIVTPGMWSLRFRPDGSGQVGFGSSVGDQAGFPQGTFAFRAVYERLYPQTTVEGDIGSDCAVSFVRLGDTSTKARYCTNRELMASLFERAVTFAEKTGTRVQEMFETHPPVP